MVENPLEDVSHLDERIQHAFKSGRIAKNGKAKLAAKASICPHCSAVYASAKAVEIHIQGTKGKKPKKPTCPYSSYLPFLPSLPHPTDMRFGRTALPDDPSDRYKGRKGLILTDRFGENQQWEPIQFVKIVRREKKFPLIKVKFTERQGRRSTFTGKWQSLTDKQIRMVK